MKCSSSGFTPLKIASLVVGGIAIVTHITAVAYPEWDGIDTKWYSASGTTNNLTIKSHGSLWKLTVEKDETGRFFASTPSKIDTAWKKPIILMATTGIVAGVLGEGLLVVTALLETCTNKAILPMCSNMASFLFTLCAAFESLMGAILYMFNFEKQHRPTQCNSEDLPVDELVLRAGFYIECGAGGLFLLMLFLSVLDILYHDRRQINSVTPSAQE